MRAAREPRACPERGRMLVIDPESLRWRDSASLDLPDLLRPGDRLVLNDAATLPASLPAQVGGAHVELRLLSDEGGGAWRAVAFGAGDWRTPTERRPPPPPLPKGTRISIGGLSARVAGVSPLSPRLILLRFDRAGEALWRALYAAGRPVQYSYLSADLPLAAVQTAYASRPWASEMPSAGYALRGALIVALRRRGVVISSLTHAAGLSSTGDPSIDAALPLPERYLIPRETAEGVAETKARGGRVIAAGTSVVRALEGSAERSGRVSPGPGRTGLKLGPGSPLRVVDGLFSGMHRAGESSHYELLTAFAPPSLIESANQYADELAYEEHEFGDACLILPGVLAGGARAAA